MYVKVTGGIAAEYTFNQLRADNPNVSFPANPSDEILADYDVFPAITTPEPAYDPVYETATYDFSGSGSTWTQDWTVVGNGISDEDLKAIRYDDNYNYCQALIVIAESTPTEGATLTPQETRKSNARSQNQGRSNNQAKVSDADDALFDWIDTAYDALDQADDTVENLDRAGLESWLPANATWPAWTPYAP